MSAVRVSIYNDSAGKVGISLVTLLLLPERVHTLVHGGVLLVNSHCFVM